MTIVTAFKDVVALLLVAFLVPVWIVLGFGIVVVIVARQMYWWARGNTTVVSRPASRVRSLLRNRASTASARRPPAPDPITAVTAAGIAHVPAGGALPAVSGMSVR